MECLIKICMKHSFSLPHDILPWVALKRKIRGHCIVSLAMYYAVYHRQCIIRRHEELFDIMTCFDAMTNFLSSWHVSDIMTNILTSWRVFDVLVFSASWRVFLRHDEPFDKLVWPHDVLFTSWRIFDVLPKHFDVNTYLWHHDVLFNVFAYFWRHDIIFASWWTLLYSFTS